jgi:hypothetical protein
MSQQHRNEKEEEKRGEKEEEKRNEKNQGWDEKWQQNPVRAIAVAAILIWGGIVALIGNFASIRWEGWAIFLIGTGIILLIKAGVRLMPAYRRPAGGSFIIGLVLLGVGLGDLLGWQFVWPVILIVIALVIIFRGVYRRPKL